MNAEQAHVIHTVLHGAEIVGTAVTMFQPHVGAPILVAVEAAKVYLDLQEGKDATEEKKPVEEKKPAEENQATENAEATAKDTLETESKNATPQTSETLNPPGTEVKFDPVAAIETNQSIEVKTPQEGTKSEPGVVPPPPPPPPEPKNTPGMGM